MFSMSSLRVRKIAWPLAVAAAAILVVPAVAFAAPGVFTSTNATPAVRASNSNVGLAVDATAPRAVIRATSNGTGRPEATIWARQFSTGNGSPALYAKTYVTSGVHYGAQGVNAAPQGAGVYGQAGHPNGGDGVLGEAVSDAAAGVVGTSPGFGVVGAGGAFGVLSAGDLGTEGNVYDLTDGGVAGVCTVSTTPAQCSFGTPFVDPSVEPVVIVTPQGNPGGAYWVSGADENGFMLNLATAPSGPLVFGYQVIGTFPAAARSSSAKASAVKARD